ncbi:hypothetical protein CC78DRAFT_135316 [Lojkania enalia]|uniref:Uncharacterized protein n=1 Tax=Lojkania enalia TaxID=147567 RepID=A0A9P4NC79_9PLEO|nr:hypothetical protein CC78DRAFT_135316 [Didymosphaeria enalia]
MKSRSSSWHPPLRLVAPRCAGRLEAHVCSSCSSCEKKPRVSSQPRACDGECGRSSRWKAWADRWQLPWNQPCLPALSRRRGSSLPCLCVSRPARWGPRTLQAPIVSRECWGRRSLVCPPIYALLYAFHPLPVPLPLHLTTPRVSRSQRTYIASHSLLSAALPNRPSTHIHIHLHTQQFQPTTTTKMRTSFAFAVLAAASANAIPQQSVQPITQISDGQIQAPPATAPPAVPTTEVLSPPAETSEVVPVTSTTGLPIIPPVINGTTTVIATGSGVPSSTNSSVILSGTSATPSATTGAAGAPSSSGPPEGAANVNMANMGSFGGLLLAVAGLLV